MKRALVIALIGSSFVLPALPAVAQQQDNIRRVVVYGNDPCPRGEGDEIVVCARRPDNERYRIPEELRDAPPDPQGESWADRAQSLEYVGSSGIQSCSTSGPGGASGCYAEMVRKYRAEREQDAATTPE